MKQLEQILNNVDGYLISIKIDTMSGFYFLEVGLPTKWIYRTINNIECEVLLDTEDGVLLKIFSKNSDIVIDDLVQFLTKIIEINKKILEEEEKFNLKIAGVKEDLQKEIENFYDGIEQLKESSFNTNDGQDEK